MAPSLRSIGVVALACAGSVSAKQWHLAETWDTTNFFDKFTFFSNADPNSGHVVYQTKAKATELGLAKYEDSQVYLGPDKTNVLDSNTGRPSVRLQSATRYNHGLFIARFTHLPESACGAWPAFWSVGNSWPNDGEIDIIEGWNLQTANAPAFHTGDSNEFGTCKLDGSGQTATVSTSNCDNTYSGDGQSTNQGCTATDSSAPYGASDGGVYALEWTDSYIKLFAWKWSAVPDNIDSSDPDTDSWGEPNIYLKNDDCSIDNHFIDQTLIINIAFCGNPVGNTDKWATCKENTGYDTCSAYVSAEPTAFENTYFKIKDIRYFKTTKSVSSSTPGASTPVASTPVSITTGTKYNNGSVSATTASVEMTTSVVYGTQTSSVTSCAAAATDCTVGSVVTEAVVLYTTVCPVTAAQPTPTGSSGSGSGSGSSGSGSDSDSDSETITETLTKVHTITSCAATVTNCPARSTVVSTEYITTTYCPGNASGSGSSSGATATPAAGSGSSSGSSGANSSGFWPAPAPSKGGSGSGYQTPGAGYTPVPTPSIANPVGTPAAGSSSGSGSGSDSGAYTPGSTAGATSGSSSGSTTTTSVAVTGGATKMAASLSLLIAAAAVMMI